jgi:hypothetical protein
VYKQWEEEGIKYVVRRTITAGKEEGVDQRKLTDKAMFL